MTERPITRCASSSDALRFLPAAAFLAFFCLSCRIMETSAPAAFAEPRDSAISRILGSTRLLASVHFVETADRYFHRGIGHRKERAMEDHPVRRLQKAISPETVEHVYGYDMRELVPWLWFAVEVNPENVDAYLIGAYILSRQIERPDAAHQLLQKGAWENPMDYRIASEDARVYLREGRVADAMKRFEAALAFADRPQLVLTDTLKEEKASILTYLGLIYESQNRTDDAIRCYARILELFPERTMWRDRIEDIRANAAPSVLADRLWHDTLRKHDQERGVCRHEEHHHHHEEEHEEDGPHY